MSPPNPIEKGVKRRQAVNLSDAIGARGFNRMAKVEHLSLGSLDAEVRILIYVLGAIHVAALVSAVTRMHARTIAPIKMIAADTLMHTHNSRADVLVLLRLLHTAAPTRKVVVS